MKIAAIMVSIILLMSACTVVPIKTLYKLYKTDISTLNPRLLRAAVRLPEYLDEGKKGMVITLSSWKGGTKKEDSKTNTVEFKLETVSTELELSPLKRFKKAGTQLIVYKLAEKDIAAFEHFRAQHNKDKGESGKQQGSFSASSDACRKGDIPNKPLLISNWLRVDLLDGYLPVLIDYDLKKEINKKSLNEVLPLCQI